MVGGLSGRILGAEERGNQASDGLPPSGVNPARAGRASSPNPTANLVGSRKGRPTDAAKRFAAFVIQAPDACGILRLGSPKNSMNGMLPNRKLNHGTMGAHRFVT